MDFLLYLLTSDNHRRYCEYPHENDDVECNLINKMYKNGLGEINDLNFGYIYKNFLGSVNLQGEQNEAKRVEVSNNRECRPEKMSEDDYEELKKRLKKNCLKKEDCPKCSIDQEDCPLIRDWKQEGAVYKHSYPILGEYLPDLKKVVLYRKNIDDACGEPTYNGVLSTYVHELFHAYFHYFTEHHNKAEYNPIREIEEAMAEFSALVFLRVMEDIYEDYYDDGNKWSEILEWTKKSIGEKQKNVGDLPAYGFGRYLFDKIKKNEACDWINKYAERLGYIDEKDELVKQYQQMVRPWYPSEPKKCMELLRKILFETNNKL